MWIEIARIGENPDNRGKKKNNEFHYAITQYYVNIATPIQYFRSE